MCTFNTVYLTITQRFDDAGRKKINERMQNMWIDESSQSCGGRERRFSVITARFAASNFSVSEIRAFMSFWEADNDGALQRLLYSRAWKGVIRGLGRQPLLGRQHLEPISHLCFFFWGGEGLWDGGGAPAIKPIQLRVQQVGGAVRVLTLQEQFKMKQLCIIILNRRSREKLGASNTWRLHFVSISVENLHQCSMRLPGLKYLLV